MLKKKCPRQQSAPERISGEARSVSTNYLFVLRKMFHYSAEKVLSEIFIRTAEFFLESFSALWLLYRIIEIIEKGGDFRDILPWITGMALAYGLYFAFRMFYEFIRKEACDVDVCSGFEKLLFDRTAETDMIRFDDPAFYAEYKKAVFCVRKTVYQIFSSIVNLTAFGVMLVNTVIFLCALDAWLLLFGLAAVATWRLGGAYGRYRAQETKRLLESERKQDYVRRVYLDRSYAQEIRTSHIDRVLNHIFESASDRKTEIMKEYGSRLKKLSFWRTIFSVDGVEICCYVYAVIRILLLHDLSVAELAVLFSAVIQYASRLRRLIGEIAGAQEKSSYVDSLRDFLETEPMIRGNGSCEEPFESLEVRNLCFRYTEKEVLHDVSFRISAGEVVMLVGPNGSGKSTLVKLLLRLYDPCQGEILYNGRPVQTFDPSSYRRHFAYMPQDFQIYDMSMEENVLMGKEAADTDLSAVLKALDFAGIGDLPKAGAAGIHTQIGRAYSQEGMELSGGQKQRLALARLQVYPFDLYILDEPSSALDPLAEAKLFRKLREMARGKTVLFISHRFLSAQYADRVLLLDQGRLTESGTHADLMRRGGFYSELFRAQAGFYQEDIQHEKA